MMKRLYLLLFAFSFTILMQAQTAISDSLGLASIMPTGDYYLTSDIIVDSWEPIPLFSGTLDGRGHCVTIKDSHPDGDGRCGFFITTDGASISNFFLRGFYHDASSYAGGFAAIANNTIFRNCESGVEIFTESTAAILGGFVGIMSGGTLDNCICCATLDGYQLGGMVGVLQENSSIRNSIANITTIYSFGENFPTPHIGYIALENYGSIENVYVSQREPGWYLPSIGQLMLMNRISILCYLKDTLDVDVQWANGVTISSSQQVLNTRISMNENGAMFRNGTGTQPIFYLAHDYRGTRYNVGDSIMIGGCPSYIFYVNEDGNGGCAATFLPGFRGTSSLYSATNTGLENFYNNHKYFQALDYEFAQSHHNVPNWWGETMYTIPEAYYDNPGKYFTHMLRSQERNLDLTINRFEPAFTSVYNNNHYCYDFIRQFAFLNQGSISNCYYSRELIREQLTGPSGSGTVSNSKLYTDLWYPYVYADYGSFLAPGEHIETPSMYSRYSLADTLNAWVAQHPDQGFVFWDNSTSRRVNDSRPILKYDFSDGNAPVNTAVGSWIRDDFEFLRYVDINHLPDEYNQYYIQLSYYGSSDSIYADNVTSPWDCSLYITEHAALKGDYKLKANVGVTLDNSDASGFAGANYDWHMVSTPLVNAPVNIDYSKYTPGGPFGNPSQVSFKDGAYFPTNTPYASWDMYCYDEINSGWPNFKRKTNDHYHNISGAPINYTNETNLIPGKGYLMAIDKKTFLNAFGTLNNDTVIYSATCQGWTGSGYNLIGNPYHAALDFDAFYDDNEGSLAQPSFSVLDADFQGYITYLQGASNNPISPSRYLHPHQGFFVTVPTDTTLVFTPSQTTVDTLSPFRHVAKDYPLVNLWVTDQQGRNDYVTIETDRPQKGGALKLEGILAGNSALCASVDQQHYSIAFLEKGTSSVPLQLKVYDNGIYTIKWECCNGYYSYLHLIDHVTGDDIDCLGQQEYVFHAAPDDYSSRFQLCFSKVDVQEHYNSEQPFAIVYSNTLHVLTSGTLEIMDVLGRVLTTYQIDTPGVDLQWSAPAPGIYLLRLSNDSSSHIQKLIL